jgi:glutamate racemase
VAQSEAGVPVLGLIDAVARQVQQQRIGVLATEATASSGAYGRALQAQRQGLTIVEMGCPAFVPAVEAHQLDTPALRRAAQRYLEPLLDARVEAIVLGCSHYPLLEPMLRDLLPAGVELIDPAHALVDLTLSLFPDERRPAIEPDLSACRVVATGNPAEFAAGSARWLGQRPPVEQISLQPEGHGH